MKNSTERLNSYVQTYTSQNTNEFPEVIGIYKIFFKNGSGKCYIGSCGSLNLLKYKRGIKTRWKNHISKLRLGVHHSNKLQNAYNKYGDDSMTFEVLEICNTDDLRERESHYINLHNSIINGYNTVPAGDSCLGYIRPPETIEKIKLTHRIKNRQSHEVNVLELVKTCKNCMEIARVLNISHNIVRRILKDHNITPPKNGEYRIRKIYGYLLSGDFIGEWDSAKDCAKQLGLKSVCTISHVAAKHVLSYKKMWFSYELLSKEMAQESILERLLDGKNRMSEGTKTRERLKREKTIELR